MARPRLGHGLDLWMNGELVGQRFDRRLASDGSWWLRLLQEDGCQALGLPPGLNYQSDGGPGITDLMALLGGSQQPQEDRLQLFRSLLLFWLLAAIDGHAKNVSLVLAAGGAFRLTPLYDILSAYPVMGKGASQLAPQKVRMAMALNPGFPDALREPILTGLDKAALRLSKAMAA